jgi:hypothetical protein
MHLDASYGRIDMRLNALRGLRGRIRVRRHRTKDLVMTLAALLLVATMCAPSAAQTANQESTPQSVPEAKPSEAAATQDQATAPTAQNPPAPSQAPPAKAKSTKTPSGQTHPTTTRSHHKKRVLPPCESAPAAGQVATGANSTTADSPATGPTAPAETPSPCPPSKVVVRQGGTSEPSIQLAGGTAGDQTSHQREVANQILGSADANLKKIAGHQLTSTQQDTMNQIRQFMGESKAAMDAGDLERARTLAWKAQVLSEELVKPQK